MKPKQYIQGWTEFYKLKFKLTADVLIPRPETELLVDEVLSFISTVSNTPCTVLDVGTGSGNIAISVAKNAPGVKIIATEISAEALRIAKLNAKFHKVEDRIRFIKSDMLQNSLILEREYKTLIIVTNLPYIPSARIAYLDSSVKDYEPHIALDGGEDGFMLYRKLFQQIKTHGLKPKLIVTEIDYTHADIALDEARKLLADKPSTSANMTVEVKTDLAKKQRILLIKAT